MAPSVRLEGPSILFGYKFFAVCLHCARIVNSEALESLVNPHQTPDAKHFCRDAASFSDSGLCVLDPVNWWCNFQPQKCQDFSFKAATVLRVGASCPRSRRIKKQTICTQNRSEPFLEAKSPLPGQRKARNFLFILP